MKCTLATGRQCHSRIFTNQVSKRPALPQPWLFLAVHLPRAQRQLFTVHALKRQKVGLSILVRVAFVCFGEGRGRPLSFQRWTARARQASKRSKEDHGPNPSLVLGEGPPLVHPLFKSECQKDIGYAHHLHIDLQQAYAKFGSITEGHATQRNPP